MTLAQGEAAGVAAGTLAGATVGSIPGGVPIPSLKRRKRKFLGAVLPAPAAPSTNPLGPPAAAPEAPAPPRVEPPPSPTPREPITAAPKSLADGLDVVHVDPTGDSKIPGYENSDFDWRRERSVKGSAYDVPAGSRLPGERVAALEKPPKVVGNSSKKQWRFRFWSKQPDAHQKAHERPWDSLPEVAPKRKGGSDGKE